MNERKAFLKLLAKNEDDTTTRLVYADWLDEHGEHEEADRQRKWPAAREWLVQFCKDNNPPDDEDLDEWVIDFYARTLVELAREAVEQGKGKRKEYGFSCGNNMGRSRATPSATTVVSSGRTGPSLPVFPCRRTLKRRAASVAAAKSRWMTGVVALQSARKRPFNRQSAIVFCNT